MSYLDGNVYRVASIVYSVRVRSFDGLRASAESEELRFFAKSELAALPMPATQRPVIGAPPHPE